MNTLIKIMVALLVVLSILLTACAGADNPSAPIVSSTPGSGNTSPAASNTARPVSTFSSSPSITASSATTQASGQTARDILDASMAAVTNIKTLKMNVDTNMNIEVTGGTQPGKMTMRQMASGSLDNTAKKMAINMTISMDVPNQGKQDVKAEMYGAEGWLYIKTSVPMAPDQWLKMKLTEEVWEEQSGISNMSEFIQSATESTLEGSETVGGIDCYMLKIVPDMKVLSIWLQDQLQSSSSGLDLSKTDIAKTFKKIAIKEWIAKGSKMPMQEQVALSSEMTAADLGIEAGSLDKMTMDISMTMLYSDFNQPVNVVVPAQAQNAQEIPSGQ